MNVYRVDTVKEVNSCGNQIESITFDDRHAPISILNADGSGQSYYRNSWYDDIFQLIIIPLPFHLEQKNQDHVSSMAIRLVNSTGRGKLHCKIITLVRGVRISLETQSLSYEAWYDEVKRRCILPMAQMASFSRNDYQKDAPHFTWIEKSF